MKEKVIVYPAVLDNSENSDDVYTVTFPDVPGAISEGKGACTSYVKWLGSTRTDVIRR